MQLTITRPDDWHLHLRDGEALASVLAHTAAQFARAIVGEADLLLYEIYKQRFILQNYGFANALTVVMILILLVFTLSNFLLSERSGKND